MATGTSVRPKGSTARAARLSRSLDEKRPRTTRLVGRDDEVRGHSGFLLRVSESGEATVRANAGPKRSGGSVDGVIRMLRALEHDDEANVERAGRRARGQMRRFAVHNLLRYMWVLTYEEAQYSHTEVVDDVRAYVRRLRRRFGRFTYMYGLEPHPGRCSICREKWDDCAGCDGRERVGHGWHVNLFVGRRLPQRELKAVWGHGHQVKFKDWGRDRKKGRSLRERVRAGAGYGAKYAAKGVEELAVYGVRMQHGDHRYEVSRGHSPRWERVELRSHNEALAVIAQRGRVVRIIECDELVGGGLWVRFLPETRDDP